MYFGGGYRVYLPQLSGNVVSGILRQAAETGIPIWENAAAFCTCAVYGWKRRHTLSHGGTAVQMRHWENAFAGSGMSR
ncbi:MAG: hypothetical protein ACLR5S_06425 [Ruminococcus sp.]